MVHWMSDSDSTDPSGMPPAAEKPSASRSHPIGGVARPPSATAVAQAAHIPAPPRPPPPPPLLDGVKAPSKIGAMIVPGDLCTALQRLGLLGELDAGSNPPANCGSRSREAWLDLLCDYYRANGNADSAARRKRSDRFISFEDDGCPDAQWVIDQLVELSPEVTEATIARVGGADGPLALWARNHIFAIVDESPRPDATNAEETISLRSLVIAFNMALARSSVPRRFVDLPSDGRREAFVVLGPEQATYLCQAGLLEARELETMHAITGW